MRSQKLLVIGFLLGGAWLLNTSAQASTYHRGTPKALRGCWYSGKKSYLEYWANHTGMNQLQYSPTYGGYLKADPYGLTYVKYKYLGYHTYRITGWTYSTSQDFREIAPTSERYTYNVRLLSSQQLYLCDRQTTYTKYQVTPSWIVE
ncbi:hypothetical protein ACFQ22_11560 [Lentilactobacillus raoultii]|uniref:Uncharacterized protein n=1 Tax=Lentilactobacillus raoultii TaxID=1987503 RepID=A0ABW3PIY0_9LACO|nr:hypothetical protein [Lentilactobacillus raoultii]